PAILLERNRSNEKGGIPDSAYDVPKMVFCENRSGVYFKVHEHRKRSKAPFAGRQKLNPNGSRVSSA
ncbi:hypothetical protein JS562_50530, partial [Agrobacterium sp. S2]|nr:hypothetical protein [Agrobacterium sp. S2]